MSEETISRSQFSLKTYAVRVFALPVSWYHSLSQIKFSPVAKKLFMVTAVSAVSVVFLAHHFKRRRGKQKGKVLPWGPEHFLLEHTRRAASDRGSSCSSSRQNLTLSLSSTKDKGSQCCNYPHGGLLSRYSGSAQSLGSVQSVNSCHSCACGNSNSWDKADDDDIRLVNIPVTTPENLYLMGMELFEEALRRWEQALTFRSRQAEDEACSSVKLGAGDAIAEENVDDIISTEFIHKLEALLQRAYRLQEEFEATLGGSDPNSIANDTDKDTDMSVRETVDEFGLPDTMNIDSADLFASATELSEQREAQQTFSLESFCPCPFYEEAMHLVEEGKIYSRVLRTEMLECLGDSDFLAKLHCIRQAFQLILAEADNRSFLAESGRKILSALIVKARKNPKKFQDVFDEMINFLEQTDHWDSTEMELAARGVKNLNFYDVVLDFILMDSFEDLENPPTSIQSVVNNRWLNSSFKETAVASSCWSVLKQKRQQMKISDGFFAHFYAICEHISPVLAWGFLGPRNSLYDLCCFFKNQVLFFLKDIFDFEKVRYSSIDTLAEDLTHLLIRRTELLVTCLGADALRQATTCTSGHSHAVPTALLEAKVQ
ncbi:mitoguardin 1 isoform X1 [Mus pahari]|uniref:mitoguardin 1 isoform X1 n=1 Tax=Mus pahari TaxID=10093 RepID=UPI000A30A264|nr:mitoguardin 1 isoform X1 [Mus pahari]XP_029393749.1 mitoguardin 1 isoform X1 [Mus pahari]XP_029393750.1 mitoguardin 1 isoform X1 [Mus pahari]